MDANLFAVWAISAYVLFVFNALSLSVVVAAGCVTLTRRQALGSFIIAQLLLALFLWMQL